MSSLHLSERAYPFGPSSAVHQRRTGHRDLSASDEVCSLRRDVDAILLTGQASVADDGSAVACKTAGLPSWLTSNTYRGALGADGGFGATTPTEVDAPTPGTIRPLTEKQSL